MRNINLEATGTFWQIALPDEVSEKEFQYLSNSITKTLCAFESYFSRFKKNSKLSELKNKVGDFDVTDEFIKILELYFYFYKITSGKLTPLIGSLLEDKGYDSSYSLIESSIIHKIPDLLETVDIVDKNKVRIKKPVSFDFACIGKGYLIDKVANFLKESNIENFQVDAGGDIYIYGEEVQIGLENPLNPEEVIGVVKLKNKSICCSSGNRRRWLKYHHIINPISYTSSNKLLSSWVISDLAVIADTIATTLFLVEPEQIPENIDFDYLVYGNDFKIHSSKKFNAEIFYF